MAVESSQLPGQRIASLSDRLARRTPPRPPAAGAADDSVDNNHIPSPAAGRRQRRSPLAEPAGNETTRPSNLRPNATRDVIRNVALSIEVSTKDALRQAARRADVSQAEVIYQALERYMANGGHAHRTVTSGGLFQRSGSSVGTGSKTVHTVRLLARNVDVIDDLVTQTGHVSRSALVEAALEAHLNVDHEQDPTSN